MLNMKTMLLVLTTFIYYLRCCSQFNHKTQRIRMNALPSPNFDLKSIETFSLKLIIRESMFGNQK